MGHMEDYQNSVDGLKKLRASLNGLRNSLRQEIDTVEKMMQEIDKEIMKINLGVVR